MTPKRSTVVGLDIGTSQITIVAAEQLPDGMLNIVGVGTAPSKGLRKGVVINIESTVQSIQTALSQAESMTGSDFHQVYASISGSHIKGFNSHGIVGIKHKEVSQDDIERVIEAAKAVAIPLDREVLHVLPQEFIIDEQDGIKEPLGISGVRLEARVHIVTGAVASAQNIVKCANRCGLTVQDIVFSGIASGRSVVSPEEQELGVAVIDIGGGTTDLAVFHHGAVKYTSVLSVGGSHITSDIAAGLRTPLTSAEEIKKNHGVALSSLVGRDETVEVPSTGERDSRVLSKIVLAEIIEPRVTEIFSLLHKELVRSGAEEFLTSGLVITGGCANLQGICQVAEQIFNLPVRVGYPRGIMGLTDLVNYPEYSSAIGLVQYGATTRALRKNIGGGLGFGKIFKKAANWLGEHF